ncbi:hypothetical protein FB563_4028 [Streptomyces puniciscabiei]|uniref:Uncharacterized protein n=1 Tax=Streptomyces puniciscabiei TaxID=164348 RepID=A0A542UIS8_9ACTN|nr:hypothetical protein [Streptomyces puniciscabiei]TQK98978.1 hypothetical protein FB563_4028 [Streptomyces puniciscabiei]
MTSSDTPTAHDLARALADQIHPNCPPRDVIVSFRVRPQAAAEFGHRSRGGPVTSFAQSLHARLYGLPADPDPLPTALDELLQSTHTAQTGDQQAAVLAQLAEQLRNAAEILQWAQYHAHWQKLPADVFDWLKSAKTAAQQLADGLDQASPAFAGRPASPPALPPAPPAAPATAPARR